MDQAKAPSDTMVLAFKEDAALTEVRFSLTNDNFSPPATSESVIIVCGCDEKNNGTYKDWTQVNCSVAFRIGIQCVCCAEKCGRELDWMISETKQKWISSLVHVWHEATIKAEWTVKFGSLRKRLIDVMGNSENCKCSKFIVAQQPEDKRSGSLSYSWTFN